MKEMTKPMSSKLANILLAQIARRETLEAHIPPHERVSNNYYARVTEMYGLPSLDFLYLYATVEIQSTCPVCHKDNPPVVTSIGQYERYVAGKITALEIAHGDRTQSEWLITGTCSPCWDQIFWMPENGPEDDEPTGDHPDDNRPSDFGGEEPDEDDDPVCVCGTSRSEHSMCDCEGFQTAQSWNLEKQFIASLTDDQFEQVYGR